MSESQPDVNPYSPPPGDPGYERLEFSRHLDRVVRVAVMLIVHGFLLLFACVLTSLATIGMYQAGPVVFNGDDASFRMILFMYSIVSVILGALGLLQVIAGIRNYGFRNRGLGITALACGLLSMFTFFCLPTSLALAIYGIIVYLDAGCKTPFDLRESGLTRAEVVAKLSRPHLPT